MKFGSSIQIKMRNKKGFPVKLAQEVLPRAAPFGEIIHETLSGLRHPAPRSCCSAAAPRSPGEAAVASAPFLNSGHLGAPSTSTNHKLHLVHALWRTLDTCAEDSD